MSVIGQYPNIPHIGRIKIMKTLLIEKGVSQYVQKVYVIWQNFASREAFLNLVKKHTIKYLEQ